MSVPANRFQVSCSYCKHLDSFPTMALAMRYAQGAVKRHSESNEVIGIFDLMAHIGQYELYDSQGNGISKRIK